MRREESGVASADMISTAFTEWEERGEYENEGKNTGTETKGLVLKAIHAYIFPLTGPWHDTKRKGWRVQERGETSYIL